MRRTMEARPEPNRTARLVKVYTCKPGGGSAGVFVDGMAQTGGLGELHILSAAHSPQGHAGPWGWSKQGASGPGKP